MSDESGEARTPAGKKGKQSKLSTLPPLIPGSVVHPLPSPPPPDAPRRPQGAPIRRCSKGGWTQEEARAELSAARRRPTPPWRHRSSLTAAAAPPRHTPAWAGHAARPASLRPRFEPPRSEPRHLRTTSSAARWRSTTPRTGRRLVRPPARRAGRRVCFLETLSASDRRHPAAAPRR